VSGTAAQSDRVPASVRPLVPVLKLVPAAEPTEEEDVPVPDFLVYRPKPKARPYRIFRTDRGFRITGTPPEGEELEEALKAAGARKGAEVEIGDEVFELA